MSNTSTFGFANESIARLRGNFEQWRVPSSIFEDLSERNISVTFAKDAMVMAEGSAPDLFACVLSGYVKIYCAVGDGNRTLMRIAGPGDLLGYADFIDQKGRRARLFEAQSLTKCNVALFSRDHIVRSLQALGPETLVSLIESLNTFWSQTTRWYALLLGLPFQQRLEMVFNDLGERMGVRDTRGIVLLPEICHEDLAEMIGCSRPMISRLIRDMEDHRKLARRGKQYVLLDPQMSVDSNHSDDSAAQRKNSRERSGIVAAPAAAVRTVESKALAARSAGK